MSTPCRPCPATTVPLVHVPTIRSAQVHALLPSEQAYAVIEVPGAEQARCQTAAVQPEATRTVWQETLEVRAARNARFAASAT